MLAVDAGGSVRTVADVDGEPGGLGWTTEGDLLVVAMAKRSVVRIDADQNQHVFADLSAITTCKCNDMVVDGSGNAYVGDFGYDLLSGAPPAPGRARPGPCRRIDGGRRRRPPLPERLRRSPPAWS